MRKNNSVAKTLYGSESVWESKAIGLVILIVCCAVDCACLYSGLSNLTWDSPFLLVMQLTALLFGYDAIPIYIGQQLKKIRLGLDKDYFLIGIGLTAFLAAVGINTGLRLAAIEEAASPVSVAMAVFGILCPVVTSLGSFYISFLISNPIKERKAQLTKALISKEAEATQLRALLQEYNEDPHRENRLTQMDEEHYAAKQQELLALLMNYLDYTQLKLKQHLGDASSYNALSASIAEKVLGRIETDRALVSKALESKNDTYTPAIALLQAAD